MRLMPLLLLGTLLACGGGGSSDSGGSSGSTGTPAAAWAPVTSAVQSASSSFPNGVTLAVITRAGVVYEQGSFDPSAVTAIASSSKWISGTVILRLVDQGVLSLDTKTSDLLVDRGGQPWSGNLGQATLRQLLSFTTGISGDDTNAESAAITLDEATLRIYEDLGPTASAPGAYFYYGNTHLRIAARMAEVATGKTWNQIYSEQIRVPLGWGSLDYYGGGNNPNPAGSLICTGDEYLRFVAVELSGGLDGATRILSTLLIDTARTDQYGPATTIAYSPYVALDGKAFHYGLCNWLETADGNAPSASNPIIRVSSTGKFGWAPWVASDGAYAALIMTKQADTVGAIKPSEDLKVQLDPLIRAALAQNPPVIRTIP
jgi:CubicO group peptidase (beta-lactamase class C family)